MTLLFPRISAETADELLKNIGQLRPELKVEGQYFAPVGPQATTSDLLAVRKAVRGALGAVTSDGTSIPRSVWDAAVGVALHETVNVSPAEASSEEVWSFLTLVVMPDLAVQRFPEAHRSRMLGHSRNVFRRCWWRRELLGPLVGPEVPRLLGEDELVGILERTNLACCRNLARSLAATVLSYHEEENVISRSEFARQLTKHVRRLTGPRMLDFLHRDEILEVVLDAGAGLGFVLRRQSAHALLANSEI